MAYDPDPAATHDPTTGVVVPTAWLDLINANFAEIGSAWTSYTPTWTSTGSAPSIGNGSLVGAYKKLGKTLLVRIRFVAGSTTTYGTGNYKWALPSVSAAAGVEQVLTGKAVDSSSGVNYVVAAFVTGSAVEVEAVAEGATSVIGATAPFTWATNDTLHITGCIEIQ